MITKINDAIITTSFENIEFEELKENQQIILLEETYNEDDIKYNDITTYYLKEKNLNDLYTFDRIKSNLYIFCDEDSNSEMDHETKTDEINYLKIDDHLITSNSLVFHKIEEARYDDELILNEIKNMHSLNNNSLIQDKTIFKKAIFERNNKNYIKELQLDLYKINYYSIIKLNNFLLAFNVKYSICPDKYSFNISSKFFIIDNEFENYSTIEFKNNDKLIKGLKNKFKNENIENSINHLLISKFDIYDIKRERNRNILVETFKDIDFGNHTIESIINDFISPFYEDKELNAKAYIKNLYSYFSPDINLSYDYMKYDKGGDYRIALHNFNKKAKAIIDFKTGFSLINIYTGEILINDTIEIYKDAQYLYTKSNGYSRIYEIIDDIYVLLDNSYDSNKAHEVICERMKLCEVLSK